MSIMSVHGHKSFLSIVDDLSKHTWAFMMHSKGEIRSLLRNFFTYAKNQYGKDIKIIRYDNGPKFSYIDLYRHYGLLISIIVLKPHNKMSLLNENTNIF